MYGASTEMATSVDLKRQNGLIRNLSYVEFDLGTNGFTPVTQDIFGGFVPIDETQEQQAEGLSFPPRLLFSYSESRELLGRVPVSTFAKWIADDLVRPVRIGPRRCFIRLEDILNLAGGLPKSRDD